MKFLILSLLFFIAPSPLSLWANDTTASIATGEIQYTRSPHIEMQKEILKISPDSIDISYEFFNHADADIRTLVAFPLPPLPSTEGQDIWSIAPSWDEEYAARTYLDSNPASRTSGVTNISLFYQLQNASFVNFKRTVNGELYGFNHQTEAIDPHGRKITSLLNRHQIPLSVHYLSGYMDSGALDHQPTLLRKLKQLNLIDKNNRPRWTTQTTFFWQQTFDKKALTIVTHSYRPHAGQHWITQAQSNEETTGIHIDSRNREKKRLEAYCPSVQDINDIKSALQKNPSLPLRAIEIEYILKTGANWRGPIQDFSLEIIPPVHPGKTLSLLCWNHPFTRDSTGMMKSQLQAFTPQQDLKILHILLPATP